MRIRWLNTLVLFALVLGTLPFSASQSSVAAATAAEGPVSASTPAPQTADTPPVLSRRRDSVDKLLRLEPVAEEDVVVRPNPALKDDTPFVSEDASGRAIYLIRLEDEPLASYRGGIAGLAPTSPALTNARGLNAESPEVAAYTSYLDGKRANFLTTARTALGRRLDVVYEYYAANNGLAVRLTPQEAASVAALPGVTFVQRDSERELHTDNGPSWIGAPTLWDGTNNPGGAGSLGAGVVIGIIDTGINYSNPSFAAVGPVDGYVHTNPLGAGNYLGDCALGGSYTSYCNDKLIGVRGYATVNGGDPVDWDGHGSHTASTAAGNIVQASIVAPTTTIARTISGVAPHANIIAYNACCTVSALTAAIDHIVIDFAAILAADPDARMSVNYSIGSSAPSDVWNDFDSVGYLNAREAGIFVATSAGNNGSGAETVGSPADAPWLTSVGATTHDRRFVNEVVSMSGGTTPPADMEGAGITHGYGPAPVVYAGNHGDALCLNPFAAATFTGQIVICDRGTNARVAKGANVLAGGAGGMILADDGGGIVSDAHVLPAVHVSQSHGEVLKAWLTTGSGHQATISGTYLDVADGNGDMMAGFSSRGANRALPEIIVPSVAAPGVSILAAYGTGNNIEWNAISGTSMASPHVAGAAALLMALHPDWTPAEVQSALMTTAWQTVRKEDDATSADPFDMGSGRVDLTLASKAGVVLNETTANYWAADPSGGGDPKTLNLASMGNAQCLGECAWERTLRSTVDITVEWSVTVNGPADLVLSVTPSTFTLDAVGDTQVIEVIANVGALPNDVWVFGEVVLTADDPAIPPAHLPVAVRPTSGVLPRLVEVHTRRNAGSQWIEDLSSIEITDLTIQTFGLVKADQSNFTLDVIVDQGAGFPAIFYANLAEAAAVWVPVGPGAKRLIAEIVDTTSPDVDMLLAYDANGNGIMDLQDTVLFDGYCQSATGGSREYCDITHPLAGNWYVIVINFEDAVPGTPDSVTLATAVVTGADAGNMEVEGPDSVPEADPFDLQLFWNTPGMAAGDRWYGAFSLGSSAANPGNIGTVPVNLIRHDDDVVKTASDDFAYAGDTLTYTISVKANVTPEDLTYLLTDTIPAGLTYVPNSVRASEGVAELVGDTLTWAGTMPNAQPLYLMTTSNHDSACAVPYANSGAYLNLAAFGVSANLGIQGDTVSYSAFTTGDPFTYWGVPYTGINFTDDGFAYFDSTPGATPWVNEDIPDPGDPNNLLAYFWNDWEIVYDAATNRGVSLASLGGSAGGVIIEYDGVQPYQDPSQTIDFEIFMWRSPDDTPGEYEIMFAYDNINLDTPITVGTIGLENAFGTDGVKYAYDDVALQTLTNGMAICFDWHVPSGDPVVITYQVTVDTDVAESPLTNVVVHDTDNPGSLPSEASFDLTIALPDLALTKAVEMPADFRLGDTITYTIVLANNGYATATGIVLTDVLPSGVVFGAFVANAGAVEDDGVITWSGELPADETLTLAFTATVEQNIALYNTPITNVVVFDSINAGDGDAEASFTPRWPFTIMLPHIRKN